MPGGRRRSEGAQDAATQAVHAGRTCQIHEGNRQAGDGPAPEAEAQGHGRHRHRSDASQHHQRPDRTRLYREEGARHPRSEEHTSEIQSLMRISYAVFCLKKKTVYNEIKKTTTTIITNLTSIDRHTTQE